MNLARLADAKVPPLSGHYIGGEWVAASGGGTIAVEDPSTGEIVGAVPAGNAEDISLAVGEAGYAMARRAQSGWNPARRQDALLALATAIERHAEEFAQLETLDAGKPIFNTTRIDVPGAAAALRYFAGWATKLSGETTELSQPGNWHAFTRREPVGVVGQIIPWNYPLMGAACKIGPALAAGCAVVLKPAEQTSLSALRLAQLAGECGFPAGFFNVVTGQGETAGAALVNHPDVAKISFTGSTPVGIEIAQSCGRQMKRCTVELGGKSPVIVMPDADIESAAGAIAMGIFLNSGQNCSAGSRLYVHESVADDLIGRIAKIAQSMRVGAGSDPETRIGPVVSAAQQDRVQGFIDQAVAEGAMAVCGGTRRDGPGYYVEPTVLTDVAPNSAPVREEIFGPVLCSARFATTDLDEIAAIANDTKYGLAAYVWTRDVSTALGMVDRLHAGTVRVNSRGGNDFALPAGGLKQSGFGRENGRVGIEAYTELKSVTMGY